MEKIKFINIERTKEYMFICYRLDGKGAIREELQFCAREASREKLGESKEGWKIWTGYPD